MCECLAGKCEEVGINIFPDYPASEVLYDKYDSDIGIRTVDKGIDKDGKPHGNFEAGGDLLA